MSNEFNMKSREPYYDNLKAVLIFLVVLGHFMNLHVHTPLIRAINNMIYSFHMPVFIFVSGFFSKNIRSQRPAEIEKILYPYFVFQLLNYGFTKMTGLGYGTSNVFIPTYHNWYLLGLFIWRLVIPYYGSYKAPISIAITFFLSLSIGFVDQFNNFLGLYRIMYFLPMFILGYYSQDLKEMTAKYSTYKYVFLGISLSGLCAIALVSFSNEQMGRELAYAYTPYLNYDHRIHNLCLRMFGSLSSIIISFGLFFVIPNKVLWLTKAGERSISIFVLHMFLVFPISYYLKHAPGGFILLISLIASGAICYVLSTSWINRIVEPFIDLGRFLSMMKQFRRAQL